MAEVAQKPSPGYKGVLLLSVDGAGATWNKVALLKDVTITEVTSEFDGTTHDDAGAENPTPGLYKWTAKATALMKDDDTGQVALNAAHKNKTICQFHFMPVGNVLNEPDRLGTGFISGMTETQPNKDLCQADISITGQGYLTRGILAAAVTVTP